MAQLADDSRTTRGRNFRLRVLADDSRTTRGRLADEPLHSDDNFVFFVFGFWLAGGAGAGRPPTIGKEMINIFGSEVGGLTPLPPPPNQLPAGAAFFYLYIRETLRKVPQWAFFEKRPRTITTCNHVPLSALRSPLSARRFLKNADPRKLT